MKRFEFTLQKLCDVKRAGEKKKRAELKELNQNLETYTKQLAALRFSFEKQYAAYEQQSRAGMEMREVRQYMDYMQYLEKEMRRQKNVIASCKKRIVDVRAALLKLINEQHVLERMRGEQFLDYQKEVRKNDDRMLEDFMQAR